MDLLDKIEILSAAARYDVSCASSGSRRSAPRGGVGNTSVSGICHSWSDDGRCISLLKVLFSNYCIYDCAYCANRASNAIPRASFTVAELVELTLNFYRRNYIEGLFLSSGVLRNPDYTMEQLVSVAETLRRAHRFGGYIHLKAIPGASPALLHRAGLAADRVSVNIELPSEESLRALAPGKTKEGILRPMACLGEAIAGYRAERRRDRRAPAFAPAGQSTQMIVGATPENDRKILTLASALYERYALKRVYYSAYVPAVEDARLPAPAAPDLLREHRLYQADWLVRFYGFDTGEILPEHDAFLDRELDPKTAWALRRLDRFPVDVNRADYETLLRVPGIGLLSARRIVASRRHAALTADDLSALGVVMKRARLFLTCGPGRPPRYTPETLREALRRGLRQPGPRQTEFAWD